MLPGGWLGDDKVPSAKFRGMSLIRGLLCVIALYILNDAVDGVEDGPWNLLKSGLREGSLLESQVCSLC